MSGLENILNCVDQEATALAEKTLNEAKLKANEIIENAKRIAEEKSINLVNEAEKKAEFILSQAQSHFEHKRREMFLEEKRNLINDILNETKDFLCQLPDNKYFPLILKLCKKYVNPNQECKIIFSKKDLSRIPANFKESLKKISENINISEITRDINGGFILSYGDIEENCSFDALFASKYDMLSDKLNEMLF